MEKRKICATCKFNNYEEKTFFCDNSDSDYYGCPSSYDDTCEDWEPRNEAHGNNPVAK